MAARPFILSAVCCALLLAARAHASGSSHGGKGSSKGDGFYLPTKSNSAWKLYSFDVHDRNKVITSLRLMPDSTDPLDAGTINTATGELFDDKGALVGINTLVRTVVGDEPIAAAEGRVVRAVVTLVFEFGSKEAGFFDDTLAVTTVIKPVVGGGTSSSAAGGVFDYDGVVTGGTGRFKAATGTMRLVDAVFDDNLSVVSTRLRFEVYVPNNLPKV